MSSAVFGNEWFARDSRGAGRRVNESRAGASRVEKVIAPPLPRLRITARGRVVVTGLVAAPLIAASLFLALNGGGAIATGSAPRVALQTVTVMAGQSLWQLAEEMAPQADPREFIADVLSLNALDSADVAPGQLLEIPSEYSR